MTDQTPPATGRSPEAAAETIPPDGLLAAGDRRARQRTLTHQAELRQRMRRRIVPAALVGSSVFALAAAADRFVVRTLPSTVASPATAAGAAASGASPATLSQIAKTLAADRHAIAALAQAQAQLAHQAAGDDGGAALPSLSLPSLGALPSSSSIAVPPIPAPATHAVTGASGVVP